MTHLSLKLLFAFFVCVSCSGSQVNITNMIQNMLVGYDKELRPNYNGPSVRVGITMYFLNIHSISEKDMDFTSDFYFRQYWKDERLQFQNDISFIQLKPNDIWTPDTFFANSKASSFHYVMKPNVFTKVKNDGSIMFSTRLKTTLNCPMNFAWFPMDTQVCIMDIESYGFKASEIHYVFEKGAGSVGVSPDLSTSRFTLVGHRSLLKHIQLSTGNYSRLAVEFLFQRSLRPYIAHIYIPSALVVILSLLGFWLGSNKVARVSLAALCIFMLIEILLHSNSGSPDRLATTALDVYLLACLITSALTLVEFTIICFLHEDDFNIEKSTDHDLSPRYKSFVCNLDRYSKIAFPTLFALFNLLYWIVTLTASNVEMTDLVQISNS